MISSYIGGSHRSAIKSDFCYTPAEIDYFLTDAEPRVFLCDPAKAEALTPIATKAGVRLETFGVWTSGMEYADAGTAGYQYRLCVPASDQQTDRNQL